MTERFHADETTRSFRLEVEDGGVFNEWTLAEVTRDLKDFSGAFNFSLRDYSRSVATFNYASPAPVYKLRPGPEVKVFVDDKLELVGFIEKVTPNITADFAEVTISGRDKTGDLIDSAAAPDGPGELVDIKLEDAVKKVAEPFGLKVTNEIDTGNQFTRYPLGISETGLSAIEKGARQRHALVTSDGIGGIKITRTGADAAPADLVLPGNMLGSSATFSDEGRHSEVIVRGQAEKARDGRKGRNASQKPSDTPKLPADRKQTDGSATERERKGATITGRARDPEIKRHRPIVHMAKSQPDDQSADDEADWRMRTARSEAEELTTSVWGYSVKGKPWQVNQMPMVKDSFTGIFRKMVIGRTAKRYDDGGRTTDLTLNSPEAFDNEPVGNRRTNLKG